MTTTTPPSADRERRAYRLTCPVCTRGAGYPCADLRSHSLDSRRAHPHTARVALLAPASTVPAEYEVQPITPTGARGEATCGTCGRTWQDDTVTGITPAPSARCPFEPFHVEEEPAAISGTLELFHRPSEHPWPGGWWVQWTGELFGPFVDEDEATDALPGIIRGTE